MKELSRFEMAAIKRTAQNVKSMLKKKATLEAKQEALTAEINKLTEMIEVWEAPIMKMTGGFTSEQILKGEMEIIPEPSADVEATDDSPLEEFEQFEQAFPVEN